MKIVLIGFAQLYDKLVFVRTSAAQYLPPGGRCPSAHTGADEERRYVPYLYAFREKGTLEKFVPFELTALRVARCRHSSSTASRSPFPPGEGMVRRTPTNSNLSNAGHSLYTHFSKSSPEGIPHLISHISYLISPYAGGFFPYSHLHFPSPPGISYAKGRDFL